jgi:PAS domain S-box-containing protein
MAATELRGGDLRVPITIARAAALVVGAIGAMALFGWALGTDIPESFLPGYPAMKPGTALSFALCGICLWLASLSDDTAANRPKAIGIVAGAVAAFGLLALIGYAVGIARLSLIGQGNDAAVFLGQMSPVTATSLVIFATAMFLGRRRSALADAIFVALSAVGLFVSFLALVGHAYGNPWLYRPEPYITLTLGTAAALFVLFAGTAMTRPDIGWVALLFAEGAGGVIARRLLPAVLLLPPLVGWIRLQGERAGLYDGLTGLALFAVANVVMLTAIVWHASLYANRLDAERRRSLAFLQSSEQRYHQVVDLVQEAIWILLDDVITFANPAAAKLLGAGTPDALIGRSILSLFHPDDRARVAERIRVIVSEGRRVPLAYMRVVGLDGRTRIAVAQALPIVQDGKLYVMGSARDVTEQREAEAQLLQAQKMESVGQLTGGIAHDFNNLLTVIIGNLDLAVDRVPSSMRPAIDGALQAAERGAGLVQRLLAFSRRQTLVPEALDFNGLVAGMEDLLRRTLGEHIGIELKLSRGLWLASADRGQVENALLNLAINARDAMPDGGKLTIETGNVHLDEDYAARNAEVTAGDYVMMAVTDTGSGMPPEIVERAFEPFFTTKEVGKGTGLGLSMIYGFAKQSGGHLKIYSEVGHGTTVRLYLPRLSAQAESAAHSKTVAADHPRGGETILVVEDDKDVRAFVISQLQDLGYRVLEAADGPQAQEILDSDASIDLLFTDVVMPGGMTGRQLAEKAKLRRPTLKTLFTSGYTENSVVHQGRLDPGVHFLSKPYKRQDLARKLRAVLDQPA